MYEAFFALQKRPFVAAPLADRYFPAEAIEASRNTLARCIERAEGAGMLVGPSGTGKTLVLHLLAAQFVGRFSVVLLQNTNLATRRALLQAILFELGLPYRGMEEGELRLSLIDRLASPQAAPDGLLLLVDEAHALPAKLMEEVRMITNLVRDGRPRARLILAGGPILEEHLASPKLASLAQRVVARCYLQSLNEHDTRAYIHEQMDVVGGSAESLFTDEAYRAVHRATDGVPRLINQVCDHAMILAFAAGRTTIGASLVEEAWSDLQQLPAPWNEASARESAASITKRADDVVSFGSLSEESTMSSDLCEIEHDSLIADLNDEPGATEEVMAAKSLAPDEEFQPMARGVPEAELFFHYESNPFSEHFADEEVIFDRYASADVTASGRGRRVYSAEGGALSAMLEPFLQEASAEALGRMGARERVADAPKTRHAAEPPSATIRIESQESWDRLHGKVSGDMLPDMHEDDRDMIIIEDDGHASPPPGVTTVRHNEYRQLFASLRRS